MNRQTRWTKEQQHQVKCGSTEATCFHHVLCLDVVSGRQLSVVPVSMTTLRSPGWKKVISKGVLSSAAQWFC